MTNPTKIQNLKSTKQPSLFNWRTVWSLLSVASLIWALHAAGLWERDLVNEGGWTLVVRCLQAATRLDLTPEFLQLTFTAMLTTLAYAVCGTFLSVLLGLVGGVLSSEVWWETISTRLSHNYRIPWLAVRAFLAIPRAIHELIWGLFLINIFGLDPLVAILAIAIPFGAITAKVFSEILDETPRQPLIVLLNSGVPPLIAFAYSLLPQAFPNLLSYSFYRFECSIRSAAVLGIIGAGGLGYQILLSLQSLRYEQMWTLMIALVILSGSTDFSSAMLRRRLGAPSRLDLNFLNLSGREKESRGASEAMVSRSTHHSPLATRHSPLILFAVVLLIFSFWYVKADWSKLWSLRTVQLLTNVLDDALPPDVGQLSQLFTLSTQTLAMSILAIATAGLGGILLSFPAANNFLLPGGILDTGGNRNYLGIIVLVLTRFFLLFTRAIPEPIWALIFLFVLFPGILPGAIALGIHNLGILGRLMAEVTENLDPRPVRSLKALGASAPSTLLYGVLPVTLPRFLAYILYRWEVCLRATLIVGLVGADGLGRLLTEQLSSFDYQGVVTTLICFIFLTFVVDVISASMRRALR